MTKINKPRSSSRISTKVGSELVNRLKRFVEELPHVERFSQRFTSRTVKLSLVPSRYTPAMVKTTRGLLDASQAVFAQFLGVSVSAVRDWEQGLKTPRGSASRLMDEVRRDPDYWRRRLRESVVSLQSK